MRTMKPMSLAKRRTLPPASERAQVKVRDNIKEVQLWHVDGRNVIEVELIETPNVLIRFAVQDSLDGVRFIGAGFSGPNAEVDRANELLPTHTPEWRSWVYAMASVHFPTELKFGKRIDSAYLTKAGNPCVDVVLKEFPEARISVPAHVENGEWKRSVEIEAPSDVVLSIQRVLFDHEAQWNNYLDTMFSAHFDITEWISKN